MDAKPVQSSILARRVAVAVGVMLMLLSAGSALALGVPEQRKACTGDVYRLCAGEIPNVRAITACLRRNKASLSDACRVVFEQSGN
jgi:hypothetical protein